MPLNIKPYGEAFSSAGLYPFIAGYDKNGKCTYVGETHCSYTCPICRNHVSGLMLCPVTEGMEMEDFRVEVECCQQKVLLKPYGLTITCLRYAPDAYPDYSDKFSVGERGVNATGPFAWRAVRSQPVRGPGRKRILQRILSVEEAASLKREGVC